MLTLLAATASAHIPVIWVVGPTDDWCATLNGTIGNDVVMLMPGEYRGPCVVTADVSDVLAEETLLVSLDPANPAVFTGSDADFVLSIDGHRMIVWLLQFRGLGPGVDAVRVGPMSFVEVRSSTFDQVDTAIRVVGAVADLQVSQNQFLGVGTAVDLGCPVGDCVAASFTLRANRVEGAGLAFDVPAGAVGSLTDEVVTASTTALRSAGDVVVAGSWLQGDGPVVDLIAGRATLQATAVAGATEAVRAAGAVTTLEVVGSTLLGAVTTPAEVPAGWRMTSSALDRAVVGALPTDHTVVCDAGPTCFTDAAGFDLYPSPGSPLVGAGLLDPVSPTDFCGRERATTAPTAGVWQVVGPSSAGPLTSAFKDDQPCPEPGELPPVEETHTGIPPTTHSDPPADSGLPAEPPPIVAAAPDVGCGCTTAAPAGPGWLALALGWMLRRRTRPVTLSPFRRSR